MRIAWLEPKRARRGWVLLGAVFSICGAVLYLDFPRFALAEDGFGLEAYDSAVWSGDLPSVWARLEESAVLKRVSEDAPEIHPRLGLLLRQVTGIRWTPARWRLWFGGPAVAMSVGEDVFVGLRAKFPARAALTLAKVAGFRDTDTWAVLWKGMYIGTDGRALLVATSPEAYKKFQSEGHAWSSLGGDTGIRFRQNYLERYSVTIDIEDELKMSLALEDVPLYTPEQRFAIDWPASPIVSTRLRGTVLDLESNIVYDWISRFPMYDEVNRAWVNFEVLLSEGWRTGTEYVQFALFDVDTSESIPVPDAAVYARSETPLGPLTAPVSAIPYEWSGNAGWMTPWQGEGAHLFVVANDRARVFTNHEATMAALMARERAGRVVSDDALIEVDAPRLAEILIELAREAGQNELWPEKNYDDVERDVVPWIRAFGALGEIRLEGRYENGPLVLRGGTRAPGD